MNSLEHERLQVWMLQRTSAGEDSYTQQAVRNHQERWERAVREVKQARAELWGGSGEDHVDG
jgi:hypothetical protein